MYEEVDWYIKPQNTPPQPTDDRMTDEPAEGKVFTVVQENNTKRMENDKKNQQIRRPVQDTVGWPRGGSTFFANAEMTLP